MFKLISNLTKVVVATAAVPVATVADILTLPSSAYNDRAPFAKTAKVITQVGRAFDKAVK